MGILSRKKEEVKKVNEKREAVDDDKDIGNEIDKKSGKSSVSAKSTAGKEESGKVKSTKAKAKKISDAKYILASQTIIKPWISEKSSIMMGKGVYTFKVAKNASKNLVKDMIESLYDVKVESVNILNIKGKPKNFKGKAVHRSDSKKAVVALKDGQKIEELVA